MDKYNDEGQELFEEEQIDRLVRFGEKLKRAGLPKDNVHGSLLHKTRPETIEPKRWRYLVRNAMEYLY